MRNLLIGIIALISMSASASTFVGNGGNSGDIEVYVAKQEIFDVMRLTNENKGQPDLKLCTCYPALEGHPICDTLKKLTTEQVRYCSQFIQDNTSKFAEAIRRAKIAWATGTMEVSEDSELNSVDAVTNFQKKQITIRQDRFLSMKNYERVFLLTHEVGHLLEVDGKPIQDIQKIGPFTQVDGGRQLLNSVAAATVMESLDTGVVNQYRSILTRSQGRKQFWIDLAAGTTTTKEETFAVDSKKGVDLGAQYFFAENFGVILQYRTRTGENRFLTQLEAKETTQATFIGATYRFFPFGDPISYFGQSNFRLSLGIEALNSDYTLKDDFISTSTKKSSSAPAASLSYYLPIQYGAWVYLQASYSTNKYDIEIPFKTIEVKNAVQTAIGVSYGF